MRVIPCQIVLELKQYLLNIHTHNVLPKVGLSMTVMLFDLNILTELKIFHNAPIFGVMAIFVYASSKL